MLAQNLKQVWVDRYELFLFCWDASACATLLACLNAFGEVFWIDRIDDRAQELFVAVVRVELVAVRQKCHYGFTFLSSFYEVLSTEFSETW